MGVIFGSLIGRVMGIALILMTGAFGVQTLRVQSLKADVVEVSNKLKACEGDLLEESTNRTSERNTDVTNTGRQTRFCRAERDTAIIAGRSIEGIVNGKNEDGSDRSGIVTSDELRNIVGQPTVSSQAN